jgi:23S rRNA pseudouridine2605 synthase
VKERLHKILARRGVASLRHAEQLIAEGRVTVNGTRVHGQGLFADPDTDDILVDGRRLPAAAETRVLMLNKPPGYL